MEKIVEELRASLEAFCEATEALDELPPSAADVLRAPLCRVVLRIDLDPSKIGEIVLAERDGLGVSEKLTGFDLEDDGGRRFEAKDSKVRKGKGNKCNFSWPVPSAPKGSGPDEIRRRLLKSVDEKTLNGGAIYTVRDRMGRFAKEYRFTNAFLLAYFARAPLDSTTEKIAFGSTFCWDCLECPRLKKIEAAQAKMVEEGESEVDWDKVFATMKPHKCGK